jgi:hypothetical protein
MDSILKACGGMVGGSFSTTVLYPIEVSKTKVQAFGGKAKVQDDSENVVVDPEKTKAMENVFSCLLYTWKTEGYKSLVPPWVSARMSTKRIEAKLNEV